MHHLFPVTIEKSGLLALFAFAAINAGLLIVYAAALGPGLKVGLS